MNKGMVLVCVEQIIASLNQRSVFPFPFSACEDGLEDSAGGDCIVVAIMHLQFSRILVV